MSSGAAPLPWNSLRLSPHDPLHTLGDPKWWAQQAFPPKEIPEQVCKSKRMAWGQGDPTRFLLGPSSQRAQPVEQAPSFRPLHVIPHVH